MEKSVDKSNMRKVIIDSPTQFKKGLQLAENVKIGGDFKNIIICGMGGSALPGNILLCWLRDQVKKGNISPIPVYIHRDYNLPPQATKESLIITISYSGNTEETLSALREAIKNKFSVVGITTNGKIEEICKKKNIPFVKIPSGIQPRCATGYLFSAVIKILENAGIIENISKEVSSLEEKLKQLDLERQGKDLVQKLAGKIPLVYASNKFKVLSRIWKIKFNENSKTLSFYNYFPELNHNEMVGFTDKEKAKNFHVLILRDKQDHPRNQKRMDLFSEIAKKKGLETTSIDIKQGNLLFKIFSTLLLGDWASYYLALERGQDPTPVKMVEEFKKKLK